MSQGDTGALMPKENKRLRLEIARLREELEAAHMTISLQQECLFKGYKMEDFQKCLHCHKIFTNHSYLVSHIERRHRTTEAGGVERGTSRDHKETQTENISDIQDQKVEVEDTTSVSNFKEGNQQTLKNRKNSNQLKKNFTSIGKKINKILKKK